LRLVWQHEFKRRTDRLCDEQQHYLEPLHDLVNASEHASALAAAHDKHVNATSTATTSKVQHCAWLQGALLDSVGAQVRSHNGRALGPH
jgi:hypothetical protein